MIDNTLFILAAVVIIAGGYYYKNKKKKNKGSTINKAALDALRKLRGNKPKPTDPPSETPTGEKTPLFTTIRGTALWKPIADSRGGVPVLLTPKGWGQEKVRLENDNGVVVSNNIEYRGLTNGDRETYFFLDARANQLPQPTIVVIGEKRFLVPDPTDRLD